MSQTWRTLVHKQQKHNLDGASPELCVSLLSHKLIFSSLCHKLHTVDEEWMDQFVAHGGLTALFDALEAMGIGGVLGIQEAWMQFECVACIKAVMNSEYGLVFVIKSKDFMHRLAEGTTVFNTRQCRIPTFSL